MTTMLTYQQRAGRFGREVRGDDETGTTVENDGGGKAVYVIDADAVAEAIVERLVAGRTIPPRA